MSRWLSLALEVATAQPAIADAVPIAPIVPIAKPGIGFDLPLATWGGAIGTNGTIGTPPRAPVEQYSGPYVGALKSLSLTNPTSDDLRWEQALRDALAFLVEWGSQAEAHSWTADTLFGLDEGAPLARYDRMGLVWLLRGRKVVALSEDAATFDKALVFRP
jgi:hypothetical protein